MNSKENEANDTPRKLEYLLSWGEITPAEHDRRMQQWYARQRNAKANKESAR